MRNWSSVPGTRSEMCVKTRSSQPNSAHARYAAARSTRAAHSSGETVSFREGMSRAAGFIVCPFGSEGSNAVELRHVVAGDLPAHGLGEPAEVLLEDLARVRPEAVGMRVVRAPEDVVLADERHDRLEELVLLVGHEALPAEVVARLHREADAARPVVVLGVEP